MGEIFDFIISLFEPIAAVINVIFVWLVYKLTHRDLNPKLYVESYLQDSEGRYNKVTNEKIEHIDFNQIGLSRDRA